MDFTFNMPYFPRISPKFPQSVPVLLGKFSNSKCYQAFHGHYFDIMDPYMRLILFEGFSLGKKNEKKNEKRPFFRAAMGRLGKFRTTAGLGSIGNEICRIFHFDSL